MKYLRITVLLLLLMVVCRAGDFNTVQIKQAAQNFIRYSGYFKIPAKYTIEKVLWLDAGQHEFGLVRLQPEGFIIFAPDSQIKAVLAYSTDSYFAGHQETLDWLSSDLQNRRHALQKNNRQRRLNRQLWRALLSGGPAQAIRQTANIRTDGILNKVAGDSIYYFPAPVWGQGSVNYKRTFNYYTPNHWSAGCVATALAEVLAYYGWPLIGSSSHCYNENDAGQLCADYENTAYDWPNILPVYKDVPATEEQRRAAGLLTFHAAVSVDMDFSESGSTAETADAPDALHNYFRCSGHYKSVASSGFWDEMRNNMKDARPAILSVKRSDGFGHAVVVDGFAEANGMFHLDMGWNGDDNGWYDIAGSWNAGGYTIVVGAAKGIVPNPMINENIQMINDTSYRLSWSVSQKQKVQYYELQQAETAGGPWTTLNNAIPDTFYQVTLAQVRNYYYRVRLRRDNIWWDWSEVRKVVMGGARYLTFNVNMSWQMLNPTDSVVVRGNILPLQGSQNSPAFSDPDSDKIFTLTVPFDFDHVGEELNYRYAIARASGGTDMESFNRIYTIGWDEYQNLDTVCFDNFTTLKDFVETPDKLLLVENYPNPFGEKSALTSRAQTTVQYKIAFAEKASVFVKVAIYNILGAKMGTLIQSRQTNGTYRLRLDASQWPAGLYFVRLQAGGKTATHKMLLIR